MDGFFLTTDVDFSSLLSHIFGLFSELTEINKPIYRAIVFPHKLSLSRTRTHINDIYNETLNSTVLTPKLHQIHTVFNIYTELARNHNHKQNGGRDRPRSLREDLRDQQALLADGE